MDRVMSVFFLWLKYMARAQPQNWPMMVATAAPVTPMFRVKMKMGSRMILMMAPRPWVYMLRIDRPVPWSSRSYMIWQNIPSEPMVTTRR